MTRRVNLVDELPDGALDRLYSAGIRVDLAQHWLNNHAIDGCTVGPDVFLAACAVHDYLCRTGIVARWQADDIARDLILCMAREGQDERLWRWLGVGYAWVFWACVAVGGALGIGAPEAQRG